MISMSRILLLGDSIRMSYQPHVARLLAGRADNGQYDRYIHDSLDRWAKDMGKPDIVHWNHGIHDAEMIRRPGRNTVRGKSMGRQQDR